ncbi:unnamed protein product [Rotaria sp. Silwood1]|nr:unnamed protein product [Rotaria sp. Silwood1]CAF1211664.1 unnamed protein product [Rotaria sp. Silwood1]CAF3451979.1 unnamed protein product [Rotaria sp. Silwood1]CAF3571550.1 unnamed protein product [Rotaria sp. Silwood1]CAF4604245.1 unnamed protein product [Rotaria sp. Silwood1]
MAIDLTKSRRKLPSPMLDRSAYSIFSVLKQAIGKDLTRFSIPIIWNEPLSFLQRLSECLEHSSLLDQAALADTPIERFHLLTAFIVSHLSNHLERTSKPFNPLLGETFELKNEKDAPFHFIAEQVCHHPPISAMHARGLNWILTGNIQPVIKFHGTNVAALDEGKWVLRIRKKSSISRSSSQSSFHSCTEEHNEQYEEVNDQDNDYEEYTWKSPDVVVHNILFGHLWCEFQGQITLQHTQSNRRAVLTIKSHSWFASQATKASEMFKFSGYIYDGDDKLSAFHGNYGHCYYAIDNINDFESKTTSCCSVGGHNSIQFSFNTLKASPCNVILTPSSRLIWHRCLSSMTDEELESRPQYYYFTSFTMCLNEEIFSTKLPPTDCRNRQDIRFLEKGILEAASAEKHRLEEQQRTEARNRECDYQPLWFKKNDKKEYIYTGEYEKRKFDHCPNLFSQTSCL